MASSMPGMSGTEGRPPVAITMVSARVASRRRPPRCGRRAGGRCRGHVRRRRRRAAGARRSPPAGRAPSPWRCTIAGQSKEALAHRPAVARRVGEVVAEVRGVDQQLLRDAAAVDAGAAQAVVLDHRGACAVARGAARAGHAARAAADHQQVVVRHGPVLFNPDPSGAGRSDSLNIPHAPGARSARLAYALCAPARSRRPGRCAARCIYALSPRFAPAEARPSSTGSRQAATAARRLCGAPEAGAGRTGRWWSERQREMVGPAGLEPATTPL